VEFLSRFFGPVLSVVISKANDSRNALSVSQRKEQAMAEIKVTVPDGEGCSYKGLICFFRRDGYNSCTLECLRFETVLNGNGKCPACIQAIKDSK